MSKRRVMPADAGPSTRAVRAGQARTHEGEHNDPIYATSSFVFESAAQAAARFAETEPGNVYSRFTSMTPDEEVTERIVDTALRTDSATFISLLLSSFEFDVSDRLYSLPVPMLVVGSELMFPAKDDSQHMLEHYGFGRGSGLYLGVELVRDRETREPAPELLAGAVERCREAGVLLSTDGPDHDVLKVKPPLAFGQPEAELLLSVFDSALSESG